MLKMKINFKIMIYKFLIVNKKKLENLNLEILIYLLIN